MTDDSTILEEDGLFWWADTEVPERQFAPDSAITGRLKVTHEGRIEVALHGELAIGDHGPRMISEEVPEGKCIAGKLKQSGKTVFCEDISRSDRVYSTNNINHESYSAMRCLVSDSLSHFDGKVIAVLLDLNGFEDWLWTSRFRAEVDQSAVNMVYERKKDSQFRRVEDSIELKHYIRRESNWKDGRKGLFLSEDTDLVYNLRDQITLREAIRKVELMRDFMVMVTGSDYRSGWPEIKFSERSIGTLYYFRLVTTEKPPERHMCFTLLSDVDERFGSIFFNWIDKSTLYGPGFYLYLSTRKGVKAYNEQRFFSLVSGLETLHRSVYGDGLEPRYAEKVKRIVSQISLPKDKRWLKANLDRFGARSLNQRLEDMFRSLPIDFRDNELKAFCQQVASIRNSLAHHGNVGNDEDESDADLPLWLISDVLSALYHMVILSMIGFQNDELREWWNKRLGFHHARWVLGRAKLIAPR